MHKKRVKKWLITLTCFILISLLIVCEVSNNFNLRIKNNVVVEINSVYKIGDLLKDSDNIKIINKDKSITTSNLGKKKVVIKYKNIFGTFKKKVTINIKDTKKPEIEFNKTIYTFENEKVNLLENVKVHDNSNETITPIVEGTYDYTKAGEYKLKYVAKDSSGNEAKETFTLIVNKTSNVAQLKTTQSQKNPYYIEVIRNHNVVVVYGLDGKGEYTKIVKVFICSVGLNDGTPTGTFKTTAGQRWHALFGGVFGQYTTRIDGHILFHSVPYTAKSLDALEYDEYNKLGSAASMGCIRMRVVDVKWIYDNCPIGMTVKIYDGNLPDGVSKPSIKLIDTSSSNKGWDPTDPDSNNPWNL